MYKFVLTAMIAFSASTCPAADVAPAGPGTDLLPLLDVSRDTRRPVIVDRVRGVYLGHPSTVLVTGQTIIAVYPQGHGAGPIMMKRSEDGGRTWSSRLRTPVSWQTSKECPLIYPTKTTSGQRLLLLFSGRQVGADDKGNNRAKIRMSYSRDGGRHWSELAPIGNYGGITALASLLPLRDGSYMGLFHDDAIYWDAPKLPAKKQSRVFKVVSRDAGLTWSEPQLIARDRKMFLCEPAAIRSPEGRQIAVLLRENTRRHNSQIIFSDDEGATWTPPRDLPLSLTGDRFVVKYLRDGRLFISFRDVAAGSSTYGDWVAWVGSYEDLARGRKGEFRVRLMKNNDGIDCGYAGVEVLRDGTVVATSYGHWTKGQLPYVVSIRLKSSELRHPPAVAAPSR